MRLEFKSANELRNCRIDDERIKNIYVVADEYARAMGIKPGSSTDLELHPGETHDVAEESPIDPVVFMPVHAESEEHRCGAQHSEMNSAHGP